MWIPVKHFLSGLLRALRRARHFALVEGSAIPTKGSLVIVSGQKLSSTHASLRSHLRSWFPLRTPPQRGAGRSIVTTVIYCMGISGLSRELYFVSCSQFHSLRHIQCRPTASLLAIATLAIFRPRRIAKWRNLRSHSGLLPVTCAASTNRKRSACP